ncbi:RusA-like Holliday junction resolvase [Gordonia phage Clawz]|uniref:RusA-like resolvase n=1 Tax=Gordonia phage Clawz TaxID=2743910 RepID=A0AAE7K664_9CAUD|nr:RusA-like Holliday junction resolvase [Gordonia phage Clawz]QKY79928.1 RusA-like resolvase [Gordonia phage Clawz]
MSHVTRLDAAGIRIRLPWVTPPLSENHRHNRWKKARLTAEIRETIGWYLRAARAPKGVEHVTITLTQYPKTAHRRDADNLVSTLKPLADGIVDYGMLSDDTPDLMTKNMPVIGEVDRQDPRLELEVRWR